MVKGKSKHAMEDYVVSEFKRIKDNELGLFAIFDGHLGHNVANYLQTHLFVNILDEVFFALFLLHLELIFLTYFSIFKVCILAANSLTS